MVGAAQRHAVGQAAAAGVAGTGSQGVGAAAASHLEAEGPPTWIVGQGVQATIPLNARGRAGPLGMAQVVGALALRVAGEVAGAVALPARDEAGAKAGAVAAARAVEVARAVEWAHENPPAQPLL